MRGGKRTGAGRKVGSVTKLRIERYYSEKEKKELINLAKKVARGGLLVRKETKDGPKIYETPPDGRMIEHLSKMLFGNPTSSKDLTENPHQIVKEIYEFKDFDGKDES
ncbi:hypothetical protein BH10BAC5_BH10BAC5_17050 [soil metagenome]